MAVPFVAFLEAFVGIGLFVSGIFLLSICTLLYSQQIASLEQMLPLAFLGAALSDHMGYYFGRFSGPKFHNSKFALKRARLLKTVEQQIVKYGNFAILLGRLLTPMRSLVPLLIGISGMQRLKYSLYDLLACVIWTIGLGLMVVGIDKAWA